MKHICYKKILSPLCADTSSVEQRPSSQDTEEVLDADESHERRTTSTDRETPDELVPGVVITESLEEPGIQERAPEFSSEAAVSANIMEAMSETTTADN